MAEDTWYSNGSDNWNGTNAWNTQADGGGTGLSNPDADAHVVIQGSDTITITAAIGNSIKSLTVEAGSQLTGHASHTITISAKGTASFGTNGYAVRIHSGATLGSNVKLNIETQADAWATFNGGTGTIDTLTINHSSCKVILQGAATMGSLTITAGELDTHSNNYALTVTGLTDVAGTLTCNASTVSLGSGVTSGYGLSVAASGTFTGGSGTHTMGSLRGEGGSPGATITLSSGVTTIDSEYQSSNQIMEISGGSNSWNNGSGTLTITTPAASNLVLNKSGATLNNFIINHASAVITIVTTAITVAGNMTITAGEFNTGSNHALTVSGELSNAGTFTGNASLVTVRNLLITAGTFTAPSDSGSGDLIITGEGNAGSGDGYAFRRTGGTFTHSSGTVTFTDDTTVQVRMGGVGSGQKFNNVILNEASAGLIVQTNDEGFYCEGDLTITAGDFDLTSSAALLTVDGNVSIADGHTLGSISSQQTTNNSFGSLTIASGGTYSATSGTTEITDQTGGGYAFNNAGTFTHNKGKVKFTDNLNPYIIQSTFYDMEINLANTASELRSDDVGGAGFTILNDLTITRGRFKFNVAGDNMTVHGLTKVETNGQFGLNSPSGTHTFHGLVTVNGGTWFLSSGTNNMAGIRNVGGTIS